MIALLISQLESLKTQERLDQYIAFFEPQTSDKALERNILMGIKTIAARVDLIEKEKS